MFVLKTAESLISAFQLAVKAVRLPGICLHALHGLFPRTFSTGFQGTVSFTANYISKNKSFIFEGEAKASVTTELKLTILIGTHSQLQRY